ncbi:alpha/beta fold hydrolase [Streptomyces sp. ZYX-F-203]
MRTAPVTAAAVGAVLAAGAAGLAAGRLAGDAALEVSPDRPMPTEPRLTVHGTAAGRITLTRDPAALRPGRYGLVGDAGRAVVGDVLPGAARPDTVVRRLEHLVHGTLAAGDRVWLTPALHVGTPRTALDLDHRDIEIAGDLGPLPAWFVPGTRGTWVIAAHGLPAGREHAMNLMHPLHRMRLPVLALAHRGDPGAPRPPQGLHRFGESEWRDLDAAVRHALAHGARRVVLLGWSTGATMALRVSARSEARDAVAGLVLDSPVLDWGATVRALATARGAPRALMPLAVRSVQGRVGLPAAGSPERSRSDRPAVPVLVFHGPGDRVAPWESSRRLADADPTRVSLHTVRDAPHAAMWNADPRGYEETLRRFLTPLM